MSEQSRRRGPYPAEVRERAVRMVFDHQHEYPSQWKAIESISAKLSINHETLRIWVRRAETDAGDRPGLRSDERAGMRELERENKELRRANEMALFVYGADKIWSQLNREGIRVARCTVERLMRSEGLSGARRGKAFTITTERDDRLSRPADLVERQFWAPAPDRLWVADLTYVKTHVGWVYVAFIIDVYSRMIVGWQASRSLRSDLAIDALEMAVWNRRRADRTLGQLVHHSDMGVQYLSIRYSERLADNDIVASVGSKGDSFDNAMAESFYGLYKWELICKHGPWRGLDDVEFATMTYVDWFNHRRLHGEITDDASYTTPAEAEATYYRQNQLAEEATTREPEQSPNPGRFTSADFVRS